MQASQTTTIEIDIDVHRAIEARRTDFGQSKNDILREEVFGMGPRQSEPTGAPASIPRTRRTGEYAFNLHGKRTEAGSLKDAYLGCLRALAEQPGFLEKLGMLSTRARRIVAREPKDLFLKKPELAAKFAAPLCRDWWADTNLSRQQCEHRLRLACDVAQITFGQDLVMEFPD